MNIQVDDGEIVQTIQGYIEQRELGCQSGVSGSSNVLADVGVLLAIAEPAVKEV